MRKPQPKAKGKGKRKLKLDPKLKARGDREIKAMHAAGRRIGKANAKAAAKMKRDATGNTPLARTIGQPTLPVAKIIIGDRHRKEFGDLAALARSINDRGGLLHPVVITPGHRLIAGERRVKAWQLSKFRDDPIPVRIIDVDSVVAGEWDENAPGIRKDFTLSEAAAIFEVLLPLEKARAAARIAEHGKTAPGRRAGSPPKAPERAADKAAGVVGYDRRTIEKVVAVVEAARDNPEKFGALLEQMDRNDSVNGPFKRLTNMRASDKIKAEPKSLPGKGPYRTIVADVPWPADLDGYRDPATRGYYPYPTMTIEQICALPVADLAHKEGCALWLWITNFHLARGCHIDVLRAWGFQGSTILTWTKPNFGQGQRLRGATEHCILAISGKVPVLGAAQSTWFSAARGAHSEKPADFYSIVEAVTPAPRYAELFSRRTMPENWDGHGDQVGMLGEKILEAAAEPVKPKRRARKSNAAGSDGSPRSPEPAAAADHREGSGGLAGDPKPAVEPTLPGIPAEPVSEPAAFLDNPKASLAERKRLDAAVIANGTHVEVRLGSHGALYEAFDLISLKTGAGSGYARYPVPNEWAADLAACNAAIAGLDAAEVEALALGEHPEQAERIAARSPEMAKAQALLGAFARGWWKRDDDQPPADDQEGMPAWLRRTADNKLPSTDQSAEASKASAAA
jgi:N6-adenosine-specific RNA methylase IME4